MKERLFIAAVTLVITETEMSCGRSTTLNGTMNGSKAECVVLS